MLIRRYVIRLGRPYNSSCIRAASSGSGKSFLERAACVLGLDEESRRRREQKRAIKDIVGTAFQGTGLLGKVWASLVTKFAVQVLGQL